MRIGFKAKRIIKAVALALAGVAAITAVAFGVKAIVDYTKNDLKEINPSFEVGSLGSDGKYVADEGSLYTKEAFACDGLQIELDFDSQIDYQIFYYDDLDNFIESTSVLSDSYSGGNHDTYARMVITPRNDEDEKISWTEKFSYPKQMEIKVSKNQSSEYLTVSGKRLRVVSDLSSLRFVYGNAKVEDGKFVFVSSDNVTVTSKDLLSVRGGEKFTFDVSSLQASENCHYGFFVYEFKVVNGTCLYTTSVNDKPEAVLDKDTTHVVFEFILYNSQTSMSEKVSENIIPSINSFIKIDKK